MSQFRLPHVPTPPPHMPQFRLPHVPTPPPHMPQFRLPHVPTLSPLRPDIISLYQPLPRPHLPHVQLRLLHVHALREQRIHSLPTFSLLPLPPDSPRRNRRPCLVSSNPLPTPPPPFPPQSKQAGCTLELYSRLAFYLAHYPSPINSLDFAVKLPLGFMLACF
ncbi:hypothetical protein BJ322DRAFT_419881 [Thelephora terrestris]|uniref:Uncharacterized protein n=1 Tax=Thelephora terrestris TaxID=56493 RepID=A0A9P6LAP2_9AGAM|nr:hypothetical protein BJ322DRAFT_419881 [Thelephora terrestris]